MIVSYGYGLSAAPPVVGSGIVYVDTINVNVVDDTIQVPLKRDQMLSLSSEDELKITKADRGISIFDDSLELEIG